MAKRILLMGPVPPPYMGQSVAFSTVVENVDKSHIVINTSNKNNVFSGLLLCVQIIYYLTFYKIDLIYFTCSRSFLGSIRDIVLLFGARICRIKVINHLHGADFKSFYDRLPTVYKKLIHWCYYVVDTHVVLSDGFKTEFIDFSKARIEVVPNAYSKELDVLPLKKGTKNKEQINLLYISNLMKSKGILNLLQAYEPLLEKYSNIQLDIAGIPMKDYLASEEQIAKDFSQLLNNISKKYPGKIIYHGACIGDKKRELLWSSDIFILPTFYFAEAFPISILEAMRAGNYIVTTNHNYLPQIVSEHNGCLIQPNSVENIVSSLEKIISNMEEMEEIQNYNIKHARLHYSEGQYLNKLSKIFTWNE